MAPTQAGRHSKRTMNRFGDFPYGPFLNAFNTLIGRIFLVVLATLLGSMLGSMTALRAWQGLWEGLSQVGMLSVGSLFYGIGIFAFPAILLFALGFVLWEWRLLYVLIPTVLMWANIHRTVRWTEFDSPLAQKMKALQSEISKAVQNSEQPAASP